MCTGIETAIIGAGLSALGSGYNSYQSNQNAEREQAASNKVLMDTLNRNKEIQKTSAQALQDRLAKAEPTQFEQTEQEAVENRVAPIQASVGPATPDQMDLAGSTPKIVQDSISRRLGDVFREVKTDAKNLGTLKATGDTWLQANLDNQQLADSLVAPANMQQGNLAGMDLQQQNAILKARKSISPIGDIMKGAGSMLGSAGGSGYLG